MAPWRVALGIAVVVVLAVVTGTVLMSSFGDEPSVAGTPIAAAPTATATATATADPDPMPELHNTGEDFDQIIRSIEAYRNWLYRNPEPSLAGDIYDTECACLDEFRSRLESLVSEGARFEVSETIIHEVTVLARDPDAASVKVVDEGLPQVLIESSSGTVIDRGDGWNPRAYRFLLVRTDGVWRVRDIKPASLDLGVESPTDETAS